jgi:enamine deaminase RidA (YjgF/YER057c/UK114 family)
LSGAGGEPDPGRDRTPGEIVRLPGDPPALYEPIYGYCRVVRSGPLVTLSGTTTLGPEGSVYGETPYEQTVEILRRIVHELSRVGASPADVIQLRTYVTDISRANEVGRALGEVFAAIRPAMTMVEVQALIDPRLWVEVEVVAYLVTG